jgi:subtilisin family serine protease
MLAIFSAAVFVLSNRWVADAAAGQQDDRNVVADNAQEAQAQVATVEQFTNDDGTINLFVEMTQEPLTVVYANSMAGTKRGALARARATALVRQQLPVIKESQGKLAQVLTRQFGAREIYRTQRVINGIAVRVAAKDFDALRATAGVKTVHILVPEYPTNETSIPFLRLPDLWGGTTGVPNLPAGLTGTGVRIGIIDTGIDYQHANFGGTGALADYQANNRTVITDGTFPTAKVVGGFDFAGDAYNGSNTPAPDPDPMDCNSHGTHVAGTAAGLGVVDDGNPDTMDQGATYTGPV